MKSFTLLLASAGLMLAAPSANAAKALQTAPERLDPNTAYILVRLGERMPSSWNVLKLAAYDAAQEDVRGKGRAKANSLPPKVDRVVSILPKPFLTEQNHVRTYLVAATPGRYVISGSESTCFCLGSYQFEASAGQIIDLGTIYIGAENGSSPWAALASLRSSPDIEDRAYTVPDAAAIFPVTPEMGLPDGLKTLPVIAAQYQIARRFGNHDGQLLNRTLPIKDKP